MTDKKCPKCNVDQDGPILSGYRRFKCASFEHESGACHEQSFMCRELMHANHEWLELRLLLARYVVPDTVLKMARQAVEDRAELLQQVCKALPDSEIGY